MRAFGSNKFSVIYYFSNEEQKFAINVVQGDYNATTEEDLGMLKGDWKRLIYVSNVYEDRMEEAKQALVDMYREAGFRLVECTRMPLKVVPIKRARRAA